MKLKSHEGVAVLLPYSTRPKKLLKICFTAFERDRLGSFKERFSTSRLDQICMDLVNAGFS